MSAAVAGAGDYPLSSLCTLRLALAVDSTRKPLLLTPKIKPGSVSSNPTPALSTAATASSKPHAKVTVSLLDSYREVSGSPTEALSNLIEHISSDNSTTNSKSFPGITPAEFFALSNLMDRHFITQRKPRLSYHQGVVIVDLSPRPSHECPVTYIRDCITSATASIPYDHGALDVASYNNFTLASVNSSTRVTPDITVVGIPTVDNLDTDYQEVFMVVECGFTQDGEDLLEKLRLSIEARPEIQIAIAIFIREEQDYSSPVKGSQAWEALSKIDIMNCKTFLEYLPASLSHEKSHRIVIADHIWCSLEAASFHVWVKKSNNSPIIITASGMASGTLFPLIDIDDVQNLLDEGFLKVKDAILSYSNMVSPPATGVPSSAALASTISIDWSRYQRMLERAVNLTAHERYMDWYHSIANGGKRRLPSEDLDFKESEVSEVGADEVQESPRRSLRLVQKRQRTH